MDSSPEEAEPEPLPSFTDWELERWARLCKLRDEGRCVYCQGGYNIWRLQVHHIWPKSLFPELALRLDNGVSLCMACHMHLIHGGDSFDDVDRTPMLGSRWYFHHFNLERYTAHQRLEEFHRANQEKVYSRKRRAVLGLSS